MSAAPEPPWGFVSVMPLTHPLVLPQTLLPSLTFADFLMDMDLQVLQVGSALKRMLPQMTEPGARVCDTLKVGRSACTRPR